MEARRRVRQMVRLSGIPSGLRSCRGVLNFELRSNASEELTIKTQSPKEDSTGRCAADFVTLCFSRLIRSLLRALFELRNGSAGAGRGNLRSYLVDERTANARFEAFGLAGGVMVRQQQHAMP